MRQERGIIIEELEPLRRAGVLLTAVRSNSRELLVSTVPYWDSRSFETSVFNFGGYSLENGEPKTTLDARETDENKLFGMIDVFEGECEAAINNHKRIVDELARMMEEDV